MKKWIWIRVIFFTILIFFGVAYLFGLCPITIDSKEEKDLKKVYKKGDLIKPLEKFDFSKGDYEMYISYSWDDNFSNEKLLSGKVFKCNDKKILLDFQKDFMFKYTGKDMSTANSRFYIYKGNELIFVTSVVVDKNCIGFQSMNYGWISNDKLKKYFDKFEKVNYPLIYF